MSLHVIKKPWQAWLLVIVLLTVWKGEKGMWWGIGIATFLWLLMKLEEALEHRKRRKG